MEMRWQAREVNQNQDHLVAGPDFSNITLIFVKENKNNNSSSPVNQVWLPRLQWKAMHRSCGDPVVYTHSPLELAFWKREVRDKYKWEGGFPDSSVGKESALNAGDPGSCDSGIFKTC